MAIFCEPVAEAVLQLLMESDVEGLIGAGRYERSGERTTWRNGFRDRLLGHPARPLAAAHSRKPMTAEVPLAVAIEVQPAGDNPPRHRRLPDRRPDSPALPRDVLGKSDINRNDRAHHWNLR